MEFVLKEFKVGGEPAKLIVQLKSISDDKCYFNILNLNLQKNDKSIDKQKLRDLRDFISRFLIADSKW